MLEWIGAVLDQINWFWLVVGLLVGWNVLPQPKWVSNTITWIKNKITGASA